MRWRSLALWGGVLLFLGAMNLQILAKERLLAEGTTMLAPLAPVDPRAFMRGDYMALRYDSTGIPDDLPLDGRLVVRLDEHGVIQPLRLYRGGALAAGEHLLVYRLRHRGFFGRAEMPPELRYGPMAYFFEEGRASDYARARFAILKVAPEGEAVLAGLAGQDHRPLGVDQR